MNPIKLLVVLLFMGLIACSQPSEVPPEADLNDPLQAEQYAPVADDLRAIYTLTELRGVVAGLETVSQGTEKCSDKALPMAIDSHGVLYERLLEERGLSSDIEFKINARRLSRNIPPGVGVLFSYAAGDRLCVWLIDHNGTAAFGSTGYSPNALERMITSFHMAEGIAAAQLTRAPTRRDAPLEPPTDLRSVEVPANDFLESLASVVFPGDIEQAVLNYEKLVIVPYGASGTIPYAALPISETEMLIDRSEVVIAPSLYDFYSALEAARSPKWRQSVPGCSPEQMSLAVTPGVESALIVGDPDYSWDPEFDMPQLPGARREAISVARTFGERPLIGKKATYENIKPAMTDADMLYFASHGISYREKGVKSFIALTNGRLVASDVVNTCLRNVKLAVLSACQTGMGQNVEGGTISLARSFQKSGVRSVAMSLWNVEDDATMALMSRFSESIKDGSPPSTALRSAMLTTRDEYPALRQWASFAVFSAHLD